MWMIIFILVSFIIVYFGGKLLVKIGRALRSKMIEAEDSQEPKAV